MTWTGPSATPYSLPNGLLAMPIVAKFSAHLVAVVRSDIGTNSRQRKMS
jgi:hypothetical protein